MRVAVIACLLFLVGCPSRGNNTGGSGTGSILPTLSAAPAEPPVPSNVPAQLENASFNMGNLTMNGHQIQNVSCTGQFNLFAGNPAGLLNDQHDALLACMQGAPGNPRIHFAFAGGVISDVRVADAPTPAAARCIANIASALRVEGSGACVLTKVLTAAH